MCWLDDDGIRPIESVSSSQTKRAMHTHTNAMNIVLTCFGYRIIYYLIRISAQQFMIHTYIQRTHIGEWACVG